MAAVGARSDALCCFGFWEVMQWLRSDCSSLTLRIDQNDAQQATIQL
jgi:hypothetical protein